MKVLVIGGTVFIGRAVVNELAEAGHDVCVVHRGTHEPDDLAPVAHIHVDRAELASKRADIDEFDPEVVWDNFAMFRVHADGVLDALGRERRYVVTSSMDVYRAYGGLHSGKTTDPVPVDETSPVRPERYPYRGQFPGMDDYEKLDVEEVYLAVGATVLRLPMVYGPHDGQRREEFVLRRVRAGRKRIPIGSGTWLGTKGFVGDVARGVRLAIESGVRGETFNLGESRTYPVGLWAQMILDAAGSDAELVRVPDDKLPDDLGLSGAVPQHLLVDSSKARRALGWSDTEPREALAASVSWHLANPPVQPDGDFTADDDALAAAAG
jgi:nucleoside-diphosphate-sugar epimerase